MAAAAAGALLLALPASCRGGGAGVFLPGARLHRVAQAAGTAAAGHGFRPPPANASSWPEHLRAEMSEAEAAAMREEVRGMFKFAYQGYMEHAFPRDELSPLSCRGVDTLGGFALTLVDSLDTLVVMGEAEEFARAVRWVGANLTFDLNSMVSVFETNIRVLGGLLAGHELAQGGPLGVSVEGYRGELLELARDLGERLLPAFKTPTGMPFGSVHLQDGVLPLETPVTSTACAGTLSLEFGLLSRLTGDPTFRLAALRSARGVWSRRSRLHLVGGHVDVQSGNWVHKDAGIGTSIDSFYEYLLKSYVVHGDEEAHHMFCQAYEAVEANLRVDPWYVEVNMDTGKLVWPRLNSLQGFWPGLQALAGDLEKARRTLAAFMRVWDLYGFLPESFSLLENKAMKGHRSYPLRPELIESAYLLYRSTGDPVYLEMGRRFLKSLRETRGECGFAMIADVTSGIKTDSMESFFLSETLKYLFLLFDAGAGGQNAFNDRDNQYVFSTEGHIFPVERDLSGILKDYAPERVVGEGLLSFTQSIGTLSPDRLLPPREDRAVVAPPPRIRLEPSLSKEEDWEGEEPEQDDEEDEAEADAETEVDAEAEMGAEAGSAAEAEAEAGGDEGSDSEHVGAVSVGADSDAAVTKRPGLQRLFPHYSLKCVHSGTSPKKKRSAYIDMEDDDEQATVRITLSHPASATEEVDLVKEATSVALAKYWHSMEPVRNKSDVGVQKSEDGLSITLTFKLKPAATSTCALPRSVFDPRTMEAYISCPA